LRNSIAESIILTKGYPPKQFRGCPLIIEKLGIQINGCKEQAEQLMQSVLREAFSNTG